MKYFLLLALFSCCLMKHLPAEQPAPLHDNSDQAYPAIERLIEVMELIRKRHPDVDRVGYDRLIHHALDGMLTSLDPHSSFIHPEMSAAPQSNENINPHVESLGITFGLRQEGPYISAISPHAVQGLTKEAMQSSILQIDGHDATTMNLCQIRSACQKNPGEITTFRLKSPHQPQVVELRLVHRKIEEKALTAARCLDDHPHIAYLRLAQFSSDCHQIVENALNDLEDQGASALILDLRGNGGGDLHATVALLGLFLPPETLVVTVRSRNAKIQELKTPPAQGRKRLYPMTVLIDRMSASASELTAACLQDLKRATILGEVSYGKGSVQEIIPLENKTAVRLTVATYHTPSGKTPHLVGVTPDQSIPWSETDRRNLELSFSRDTLPVDQLKKIEAWKDPCIEAAIQVLKP